MVTRYWMHPQIVGAVSVAILVEDLLTEAL